MLAFCYLMLYAYEILITASMALNLFRDSVWKVWGPQDGWNAKHRVYLKQRSLRAPVREARFCFGAAGSDMVLRSGLPGALQTGHGARCDTPEMFVQQPTPCCRHHTKHVWKDEGHRHGRCFLRKQAIWFTLYFIPLQPVYMPVCSRWAAERPQLRGGGGDR